MTNNYVLLLTKCLNLKVHVLSPKTSTEEEEKYSKKKSQYLKIANSCYIHCFLGGILHLYLSSLPF